MEKKLDANYIRMLRATSNKFRSQHPTKQQLYGHLPPITKTIKVRRTRHAGHCWRSKDEYISDVLLWTPSHGRLAQTYILQLCADTGCSPEDLPEVMDDREGWWERVRDICADCVTWWWWWSRLNKSWRQNPTRHQLYGHLPPITKTIQVRRTRHAGHCWRSKDELISDVLLWTPTYGQAKAGRPARTYIQQRCEDTGCNPEELPKAMNDREKWRERVRDIRAGGTTWWWWYIFKYIYIYIYIIWSL